MECPNCGGTQFNELVPGIMECKLCKKIVQVKAIEKVVETVAEGTFEDGLNFMEHTGLNRKWEICEKGITIEKDKTRWVAVLICHTPDESESKYIRLSWFRKSFFEHAGMIKIYSGDVLANIVKALELIDDNFDETFNWMGKFDPKSVKDIDFPEIKKRKTQYICPNPKCGSTMKKVNNGRYYECENCGELIIMEDNNPIFDLPTSSLSLNFTTNFPINYYLPEAGITVKWLMGEWQAIVVINDPANPEKRFLRFYWWTRDLQDYLESAVRPTGGRALAWDPKRGVMSPNIYDKKLIPKLVSALNKCKEELGW
jgi:ribosomal protein L37AE/L43A